MTHYIETHLDWLGTPRVVPGVDFSSGRGLSVKGGYMLYSLCEAILICISRVWYYSGYSGSGAGCP